MFVYISIVDLRIGCSVHWGLVWFDGYGSGKCDGIDGGRSDDGDDDNDGDDDGDDDINGNDNDWMIMMVIRLVISW